MPAHDGACSALAAVAAAVAPPRAPDRPPSWLRPAQRTSFKRALAALRCHDAALLADPVGSGKTYVALAVAAALHRGSGEAPPVCLVPATLASQWARAASSAGVAVCVHSHERLSRGRLPPRRSRLVVIDESHRLRNPATRRYTTVAPWLIGCRVLLVSATPVVNRPADLLEQLRLGARDDTLAPFGLASLAARLTAGDGHPALARLVIRSRSVAAGRPRRTARSLSAPRDPHTADLAARLLQLRLSSAPDVAALVRVGLFRALASSLPALRRALVRYRTLLHHAADAAARGRPVTRRELRSAVGGDESQLVMWELLCTDASWGAVELELADLPALEWLVVRVRAAEAAAPVEPKARRLAELLADGRRTIVFASHTATVEYLRGALADHRPAWCTGAAAGVGPLRALRSAVLGAFDPHSAGSPPSGVLIATDVAAEGLNLQRAERIVHYDLPWSPTRLRQREGRAVRLGSTHARVEIVSFRAHPAVERQLGMEAVLRRKDAWPARMGLTGAAEPTRRPAGTGGSPVVVRLMRPSAEPQGHPSTHSELFVVAETGRAACGAERWALWLRPDGTISGDVGAIAERLRSLAGCEAGCAEHRADSALIDIGADVIRRHIEQAGTTPKPAPLVLMRRLATLGALAARARDAARLAAVDRALAFVRRGHTAGEARLLADLAAAAAGDLPRLIERLPPAAGMSTDWRVGLVVRVETAAGGRVRFAPCRNTIPCCSTSTARS